MKKVSIIIPVYNTEQYIEKCILSALNQTYRNAEIICVNDCSTDNSLDIIEKYARADKRIKIINLKQNKGVSYARNTGINSATGDYIIFIDSDDWIDTDMLSVGLNKIESDGSDILCFGFNIHDNGAILQINVNPELENITSLEPKDVKNYLDLSTSKIYRTDFIKNNKIKFPNGIVVSEDGIFNLMCLYKNAKFSLINRNDYNILIRTGSATNANINSVKNEIKSDKYVLNSKEYKNIKSRELKLITIEKIINNIEFYYNRPNAEIFQDKYDLQISLFILYLYFKVGKKFLKQCANYKTLKKHSLWNIN